MAIRVLLADDHAHVRAALRDLLRKDPQIEVVAEAADGEVAARLTRELCPDILLLDLTMPILGGIDAMRRIASHGPGLGGPGLGGPGLGGPGEATPGETRIIAVSLHDDRRLVARALSAGARGYLLKNSVARELVPAIHAVLGGQTYLSGRLSPAAAAGMAAAAPVL